MNFVQFHVVVCSQLVALVAVTAFFLYIINTKNLLVIINLTIKVLKKANTGYKNFDQYYAFMLLKILKNNNAFYCEKKSDMLGYKKLTNLKQTQ